MRLALDHHYPRLIAEGLRGRGHDAIAAVELGWEQLEDEALLQRCSDERRVLMTNNVRDFAVHARDWHAGGRSHFGLIFTSDRTLPRTRATIGRYESLLDQFMRAHPDERALVDRIHWL